MFDESVNCGIEDSNIFEKELVILGFKKFKCSPTSFIFKNFNRINIEIRKQIYDENSIEYNLYVDNEFVGDILYIRKDKLINNKEKYYKKYFNNELRKYKIDKLLNK